MLSTWLLFKERCCRLAQPPFQLFDPQWLRWKRQKQKTERHVCIFSIFPNFFFFPSFVYSALKTKIAKKIILKSKWGTPQLSLVNRLQTLHFINKLSVASCKFCIERIDDAAVLQGKTWVVSLQCCVCYMCCIVCPLLFPSLCLYFPVTPFLPVFLPWFPTPVLLSHSYAIWLIFLLEHKQE